MGVSPESTSVGWIGTGVMGASMVGHLIAEGYRLTFHTRTRERQPPSRPPVRHGPRARPKLLLLPT